MRSLERGWRRDARLVLKKFKDSRPKRSIRICRRKIVNCQFYPKICCGKLSFIVAPLSLNVAPKLLNYFYVRWIRHDVLKIVDTIEDIDVSLEISV